MLGKIAVAIVSWGIRSHFWVTKKTIIISGKALWKVGKTEGDKGLKFSKEKFAKQASTVRNKVGVMRSELKQKGLKGIARAKMIKKKMGENPVLNSRFAMIVTLADVGYEVYSLIDSFPTSDEKYDSEMAYVFSDSDDRIKYLLGLVVLSQGLKSDQFILERQKSHGVSFMVIHTPISSSRMSRGTMVKYGESDVFIGGSSRLNFTYNLVVESDADNITTDHFSFAALARAVGESIVESGHISQHHVESLYDHELLGTTLEELRDMVSPTVVDEYLSQVFIPAVNQTISLYADTSANTLDGMVPFAPWAGPKMANAIIHLAAGVIHPNYLINRLIAIDTMGVFEKNDKIREIGKLFGLDNFNLLRPQLHYYVASIIRDILEYATKDAILDRPNLILPRLQELVDEITTVNVHINDYADVRYYKDAITSSPSELLSAGNAAKVHEGEVVTQSAASVIRAQQVTNTPTSLPDGSATESRVTGSLKEQIDNSTVIHNTLREAL